MARFLNTDQLYRLFQRELPEGAYSDVEYSKALSTASVYAKAYTFKQMYDNMQVIYANMFPQEADEKIDDWVIKCFGKLFPGGTTLSQKQDAVVAKIRQQPNLTVWQLLTTVAGLLDAGTYVQIWERSSMRGGWKLGASKLGRETFLNYDNEDSVYGIDVNGWCDFVSSLHWRLGKDKLGSATYLGKYNYIDVSRRQRNAFEYEVRIFGALTSDLREAIDSQLSMIEPARSGHLIRDNLSLTDFGLVNYVNNVNQFSGVNCITRDVTQPTGYKGVTS